jgi:hypothetical protein
MLNSFFLEDEKPKPQLFAPRRGAALGGRAKKK